MQFYHNTNFFNSDLTAVVTIFSEQIAEYNPAVLLDVKQIP